VRYQFIQQHQGQFCIAVLCRVMNVTRSGYYAWKKRIPSTRQDENARLTEKIQVIFEKSRRTYGSPRILRDLRESEVTCGKHRVARLMRAAGIRAAVPRRFQITTDSKHELPIAENLLDRQFKVSEINRYWTADITYIWTRQGWLYLAVVLDLFSRRVVGWSMQETMDRSLVLSALELAQSQRHPQAGLIHHSDRGSQYASRDFQALLEKTNVVCSMSRKGNCWDNAPTESFFGTLKTELVHRRDFGSRQQARQEVFEYIEVWYNRKRRHSSLGYISPDEFEKRSRESSLPA